MTKQTFATEINALLCLLKEQEPTIWLDGEFLFNLVKEGVPCSPTLYYPDNESLGKAVGILVGKGYRCCKYGYEGDKYSFEIGKYRRNFLDLEVCKKVAVVDFDHVSYDPVRQSLFYLGEALPEEKREAFRNKKCALLFDPCREEKDEQIWKPRQTVLSYYLLKRWKLVDDDGNQVEFLIPGYESPYLNPDVQWKALIKIAADAELARQNFTQEFDQLLVKYGMKPSVKPK